nr:DNA-directed DNA polymerase [Tanacetum cinerariifolium]
MADRTMEELLQSPTEGYGEAIVISEILGENFEIKTNLLQDNVSKTDDRIDNLADQISNLVEIINKQVIASAKVVEKTCVTCGGAHAYYDCIATDSNQPSVCAAIGSYNQVSPPNRASHQIPPPGFAPINVLRGDFNKQEENLMRNLNNDMRSILGSFFQNQALTSGTLPSNNVPNLKGEMKVVTTRSGLAYEGPSIPTNSPLEKVDEQNTEEITDKEHSNCQGSTAQVQPPVVPISILEPDVPWTQPKPTIPYPFVDALLLMPKFASTIKSLLTNKDKLFKLAKVPLNENCLAMLLKKLPEKLGDPDVIDIACEKFVQDVLDFQYNPKSSNPTLVFNPLIPESDYCKEPIVKSSSPTLTPFGETEETKAKSSIEEPPELELKELPSHLEYAFLEELDKLLVIIAKDLKDVEKEALIEVLKSHKQAIAWKISDIKGIDPRFCTHKILMEEDYKPEVYSQRRVNPKIHDVIKKEVDGKGQLGFRQTHMGRSGECLGTVQMSCRCTGGNEFYCFLDGFSGYFKIPIDPQDQEKTTFTCPYGTFAYRRMPFGLCNAPGIVLGHKISKSGIEVDRAKVNVIAKLPHPTTIKGFRSFLGYAGFYRRFIQDFSKIARPMTHLLEKETPFVFSKECVDAFNTLKKKLTEASILVPDWNLPFELMCDASDFAIGAVLG